MEDDVEAGWILGIITGVLVWIQMIVGFRVAFKTPPEMQRQIEESERFARGSSG